MCLKIPIIKVAFSLILSFRCPHSKMHNHFLSLNFSVEINNHSWSEDEKTACELKEKSVTQQAKFLYTLHRRKKDEVIFHALL